MVAFLLVNGLLLEPVERPNDSARDKLVFKYFTALYKPWGWVDLEPPRCGADPDVRPTGVHSRLFQWFAAVVKQTKRSSPSLENPVVLASVPDAAAALKTYNFEEPRKTRVIGELLEKATDPWERRYLEDRLAEVEENLKTLVQESNSFSLLSNPTLIDELD